MTDTINSAPPPVERPREGPIGIGGWLILPVIGLSITPVRGVVTIPATYSGLGDSMTSLDGVQKAFIYAEMIFNVATLLVLPIILIVMLFQKKLAFIRWYVIWACVSLGGLVLDLFLAGALFPNVFPTTGSLFDEDTMRELLRSLVLALLWVPYMLKSRRVANTFVN